MVGDGRGVGVARHNLLEQIEAAHMHAVLVADKGLVVLHREGHAHVLHGGLLQVVRLTVVDSK